jgi:hypothetical protein
MGFMEMQKCFRRCPSGIRQKVSLESLDAKPNETAQKERSGAAISVWGATLPSETTALFNALQRTGKADIGDS